MVGMVRLPSNPLIARALEIAERWLGIEELSRRLGSQEADIRAWQFGQTDMPSEKFLKLVDIVLEMDRDWLDENL